MTLQALRDRFVAEYKFVAMSRGLKQIKIPNAMIAAWLSEAQEDLQSSFGILITYYDLALTSASNIYTLPTDFGTPLKFEYNGSDLEEVRMDEINTTGSATGARPLRYALYIEAGNYKVVFNELDGSYTVRVWYKPNPGQYRPGEGEQDFGGFADGAFSGAFYLPDRYVAATIAYMMGKAIGNMAEYEYHKDKLRLKETTRYRSLGYKMGGYR